MKLRNRHKLFSQKFWADTRNRYLCKTTPPGSLKKTCILIFMLVICQGNAGRGINAAIGEAAVKQGLVDLSYTSQGLQITARKADLKLILRKLAKAADIFIIYGSATTKKITIEERNISLEKALKKILKGVNHAIIYSGLSPDRAGIEEVLVFSEPGKKKPSSARERQLQNRIRQYKRQIDGLNKKLSKVKSTSAAARRYNKRIANLKKNIQKIENQRY